MSSRDFILQKVRANQPDDRQSARALPDLPRFDAPGAAQWQSFAAALTRMGGRPIELAAGQNAQQCLAQLFPDAAVVVSAAPEVAGTRTLAGAAANPALLADVDVGVVRAAFGVAETGSVFLSEAEFGVNALGFLPQHLVVLLDPAALEPDIAAAYRRDEFGSARYAALMTGPSATADIEGILIRGAQGVRSFTVIACERGA